MIPIIETYKLKKAYKREIVLHELDFSLKEGEICALIGKNGAGKSTLFKLLSGQIFPSTGEVKLFGKVGKEAAESRQRMGFMIETPAFFPEFTAVQNLTYFRLQRGVAEENRINEVLKIVNLDRENKKKFSEYSLGMKQRLGIALCLLSSPDCLVLDEPTNGLDAQGINEFRKLLLKLNQEQQITILISSHILSELQLLATRFVFLNKGKVVDDLSQAELHKKSQQQICLQVDNVAKTAQLLERNYSDILYKVLPNNQITIQNHVAESGGINRLLVTENILVSDFRVETVSLEDYFLELVEEKTYA